MAQDEDPFTDGERTPPADVDVERRFVLLFKERRLARGLSQADAAGAVRANGVHIDPTGITRLESGDRRLRLNEALALARAVGSDLVSMIGDAMSPDFRRQILAEERERLMMVRNEIDDDLRDVHAQLNALDKKGRARGAR